MKVGDVVFREDMADKDRPCLAVVTGLAPSPRWVRVRTDDGRYRVWLADRCWVVEDKEFEQEVRAEIEKGRLKL